MENNLLLAIYLFGLFGIFGLADLGMWMFQKLSRKQANAFYWSAYASN